MVTSNVGAAINEGPRSEDHYASQLAFQQDMYRAGNVLNDWPQVDGQALQPKPSRPPVNITSSSSTRKPSRSLKQKSSALASASEAQKKSRSRKTGPKRRPQSPPPRGPSLLPLTPIVQPAPTNIAQPLVNASNTQYAYPQHHRSDPGHQNWGSLPYSPLPPPAPDSDSMIPLATIFSESSAPVTLPPRHVRSIRSAYTSTPKYKLSPEVQQWIDRTFTESVKRVHRPTFINEDFGGMGDGEQMEED